MASHGKPTAHQQFRPSGCPRSLISVSMTLSLRLGLRLGLSLGLRLASPLQGKDAPLEALAAAAACGVEAVACWPGWDAGLAYHDRNQFCSHGEQGLAWPGLAGPKERGRGVVAMLMLLSVKHGRRWRRAGLESKGEARRGGAGSAR